MLLFKLWEQEYAIKNKRRAYKCSHSPCQQAGDSASKLFLRVSDQHSKILWHEGSRARIFQLGFLWHNTNAYLFQRKLGSSTMLPWLLGSSKLPKFTCLWFPFCEMEPVSNTAVPDSLTCILQRGTLTYFILPCRTSRTNDGKGSLWEKQKCWNTCTATHWQKCHSLVFIRQIFLHEELYKSIIIINRGVPVEHFCVSSIRKLLLIQTSRGILATNLGESSHSSSVAFITV